MIEEEGVSQEVKAGPITIEDVTTGDSRIDSNIFLVAYYWKTRCKIAEDDVMYLIREIGDKFRRNNP